MNHTRWKEKKKEENKKGEKVAEFERFRGGSRERG